MELPMPLPPEEELRYLLFETSRPPTLITSEIREYWLSPQIREYWLSPEAVRYWLPLLPKQLLPKMVIIAIHHYNLYGKVDETLPTLLLDAVIARLPQTEYDALFKKQLLEASKAKAGFSWREDAIKEKTIIALAPYLSPRLLHLALRMVHTVSDMKSRVKA